jgi:hypothetical protein
MAVNNIPTGFHRKKQMIFEPHKCNFTISFCNIELFEKISEIVSVEKSVRPPGLTTLLWRSNSVLFYFL